MTIFFTADHHFGHRNIIRFQDRPFADVTAMDEALVERWNAAVGPDDVVYHLGDVGLCSPKALRALLDRLRGTIYLLRGNHERSATHRLCADRFGWIKDIYEFSVEDAEAPRGEQPIVLMHYAMRTWNRSHHGSWQLYGHSHGTLPDDPAQRSIDVGVDCHDFAPISYQAVKAIMATKTWEPPFAPRR